MTPQTFDEQAEQIKTLFDRIYVLETKNASLFLDQQNLQREKYDLLKAIKDIENNPKPGEPEVEFCKKCNRWHVVGALALCKMNEALKMLRDEI